MGDRVQDLHLPNSVITKIIKESLPDRVLISKEARPAISKAAISFILCATSLANEQCVANRRKTIAPADIIAALKEMQFGHFEAPLMQYLETYKAEKTRKTTATLEGQEETEEVDEELEEEADDDVAGTELSETEHEPVEADEEDATDETKETQPADKPASTD